MPKKSKQSKLNEKEELFDFLVLFGWSVKAKDSEEARMKAKSNLRVQHAREAIDFYACLKDVFLTLTNQMKEVEEDRKDNKEMKKANAE